MDIEKCRITHYPADVLDHPAEPVEKIDQNIRRIVDEMIALMLRNKGIGLAGPQVGVALRIFVIALDGKRESVKVYINPEVTPSGGLDSIEEGCLSVPAVFTKIKRHRNCKVTATDLDGNEFTEQAEGLYARCLQHEYDHLQGITVANRMSATDKIAHRRQLKKLRENYRKTAE